MALPVQSYRDCYQACRDAGGTIQACQDQCADLMPTAGLCDPCCGFLNCFGTDVVQTVQSASGAVYQYGTGALKAVGIGGLGIAVALIVLVLVLRR